MKAKRFPAVFHPASSWPEGWGEPGGPYDFSHSMGESNACGLCNHQLLLEAEELRQKHAASDIING